MPKEKMSYAMALAQLEKLQQEMESNSVPIDELASKVASAAELLKYCQDKLRQTSEQIDEVLAEKF